MVKEKLFKSKFQISVEETSNYRSDKRIREIPMANLLYEGKLVTEQQFNEMITENQEIIVSWDEDDFEINVRQIHNDTTGEVYREYNDIPENRMWSAGDELVVSSLLMWGELN
jgi:hypothetical protein